MSQRYNKYIKGDARTSRALCGRYVIKFMTNTELASILEVLQENQPSGLGVFSLSEKTEIAPNKLRECIAKHPDFFVLLPEANTYAINRFGKYKGSIQKMRQQHDANISKKSSNDFVLYLVIFIAVITSSTVVFSNVT